MWKILKEVGISDHLICLLRNLYGDQDATVRTRHETMDWFKIGKEVRQGCILSPCLFNLYAEHSMWNARLDEAQAWIKVARRNISNLRYEDEPTLTAENEDHGIWSHHFIGNRWGNSGNTVNFIFWAPELLQMVTAAMKLKDTNSLEEKLWPACCCCCC